MAKIFKYLLGGMVVAAIAGCGSFTNIPAQIFVKSVEPSSVIITYKEDSADKTRLVGEHAIPIMTLKGEPGSIGATITQIDVDYLDFSGKTAEDPKTGLRSISGLPAVSMNTNVRVETSALREDYPNKDIVRDHNYPERDLTAGTGKITLPIITRTVIEYGGSAARASDKINAVTARIVLTGVDDANFPFRREISVPIIFTGLTK